ncbi:MAG: hypothetical protein Q4Q03_06635 [Bowdeniella nasicola]|nr:hypothetical protein [Bowdeniella nasicola]
MRSALRTLAAVVVATTLVAGCTPTPSSDPSEDTQRVIVEGSLGSVPTVTVPDDLQVRERQHWTAIVGSGHQLQPDSEAIVVVNTFDAATGEVVDRPGTGIPQIVTVSTDGVGPELAELLTNAYEGDRHVLLEPVHTSDVDILVTVVDILPGEASGPAQPTPKGLPDLINVDDRNQAVAMGDKPAPEALQSVTIIAGTGAQVRLEDTVIITFTTTHWQTGEVIETSGAHTPVTLDVAEAMSGLRAGLVDQRVGSRLLLVIPPEDGTGTDTLVMVVDILAAYPAEAHEDEDE